MLMFTTYFTGTNEQAIRRAQKEIVHYNNYIYNHNEFTTVPGLYTMTYFWR